MLATADLPPLGAGRESYGFDLKATYDVTKRFEMAKDMAAFANASGGTILVGAAEDRATGALSSYLPMSAADANALSKIFSETAVQRCFPTPFIDPKVIAKDAGFVLAVNVWAFPAQPVGVRIVGDRNDGFAGDAYVFPLRSGVDTKFIRPDQLPMFMVPEVRRLAIMLDSIPQNERSAVELEAQGTVRRVVIKSIDPLANTFLVEWARSQTEQIKFTLPLDAIRHVWKNTSGLWRVAVVPYQVLGDGSVTV